MSTSYGLASQELDLLTNSCVRAKSLTYSPYSLFPVGAAILTNDGTVVVGANVENASYPVGTCAERVAMATAIMQGFKRGDFKAVGVATDTEEPASPCGMCRQFLREFLEPSTPIFMHGRTGKSIVKTLEELLPMSFGPDSLPSRQTMAQIAKEQRAAV